MKSIWIKIKEWFCGLKTNVTSKECASEKACELVTELGNEEKRNDSSIECFDIEVSEGDESIGKQFVNLQDAQRKLAYLLRHDADYNFDEGGFRDVDNLINDCGYTKEEIEEIVSSDTQKRFEFNKEHTLIRAMKGHSSMIDVGLKETPPPSFLYYGVVSEKVKDVMKNGIKGRHDSFVHLYASCSQALNVTKKSGVEIKALRILAQDMYADGFKFFLSANKVWCVVEIPSFPCQYIEVID